MEEIAALHPKGFPYLDLIIFIAYKLHCCLLPDQMSKITCHRSGLAESLLSLKHFEMSPSRSLKVL
jgi:hypothetical protein